MTHPDSSSVLSLSGRLWEFRQHSDLSPRMNGLAGVVARSRGLHSEDGILSGSFRSLFPMPETIRNMKALVDCLAEVASRNGCVGVFGDYDVDGACAVSVMSIALEAYGCNVITHIPDRIAEGYGPNAQALDSFVDLGAEVVLCVDCGASAADLFTDFEKRHPDVPILAIDHHKSTVDQGERLVVNPNGPGDTSACKSMCAGALSFLAVAQLSRVAGSFGLRTDWDPMSVVDLAGLSTVCDVMPLTGFNRFLVRRALRSMNENARVGISELAHVGKANFPLKGQSLGFIIGPRINAGGRIGDPSAGAALLRTSDTLTATELAVRLDSVNRKRKDVGQDILEKAVKVAEVQAEQGCAVIVVASDEFHIGIVGIVAGRLKEMFNRPVVVAGSSDGTPGSVLKGSGRSLHGFDIGEAVIKASRLGIIEGGGGHMMAAGFSVKPERVEDFAAFLNEELHEARELPRRPHLHIDAVLDAEDLSVESVSTLDALEPFGAGFEPPVFVVRGRVKEARFVGKDMMTLQIKIMMGSFQFSAVMFRVGETEIGKSLVGAVGKTVELAGSVACEEFRGITSAKMICADARIAS